MRVTRCILAGLIALLMALAVPASNACAQLQAPEDDPFIVAHDDEPIMDEWWGVAGAVICGTGIRLALKAPPIGFNPYVLAVTIGGCLLAAMDAAT